ncbi:OLC1v1028448C1 [Oldenlandia corymbosa var. corymbosa]|uniref:OLC1v1028448C1 n=1 Tax=Oldenlandia corymbosa var. corymbosa TaxID=529605 RepID=A0AAV1CBZ5_OLDCO|nr:OLC1v1028448C1 [Oldenlandia corymbosa var. corymbosa]
MEEAITRVRLVFDDKDAILSDAQKAEGLERCWVLLKPQQQQTISDLTQHILQAFHLQPTCPHGLLLYMDGFVLPWFESTTILKDKDVISVRKKEITYSLEGNNGSGLIAGSGAIQNHNAQTRTLLLANNELEKETGGYQSDEPEDESEEVDEDEQEDLVDELEEGEMENYSQTNANSKKRKAGQDLQATRVKKHRSGVEGNFENDLPTKQAENTDQEGILVGNESAQKEKKGSKLKRKNGQKNTKAGDGSLVASPVKPSSDQAPQSEEPNEAAGEKEKRASRSARRKKAKRQWIREMAKIQKKSSDSKTKETKSWKQKSGRADVKKNNWKQKSAQVNDKEDDGQPKGLLYWKQSSQRDTHKDKKAYRDTSQNGTLSNQSHKTTDVDDEVVPVLVRPGHIRFEPREKEDDVMQNQTLRCAIKSLRCLATGMESTAKERAKSGALKEIHFLGEVGDVIAYRLLELSSSWTPEVSAFRVGHVSWCDDKSGKLVLMQIPGHPIVSKNSDEEEPDAQQDSLYKEDGSLEVDFRTLIDVRIIKDSNEGSAKGVTVEVNEDLADASNAMPASNKKETHASTIGTELANGDKQTNGSENGKGATDIWDQLSKELSAKKEQLSAVKTWESPSSGGKGSPWLRRSALGPTMAYLRSKNQL